jgi:hypothetical protein
MTEQYVPKIDVMKTAVAKYIKKEIDEDVAE